MSAPTPLDDVISSGTQERGTHETAVEISTAQDTKPDPDLDPAELEARMVETVAAIISKNDGESPTAVGCKRVAEEAVRALLLLQGSKGRKLFFTRYDIMQIFAIWSKKLQGGDRV